MSDKPAPDDRDTMRDEYDFTGGVRGRYAARTAEGTNVMLLDPDVYEYFRDSASVNEALRALIKIRRRSEKMPDQEQRSQG